VGAGEQVDGVGLGQRQQLAGLGPGERAAIRGARDEEPEVGALDDGGDLARVVDVVEQEHDPLAAEVASQQPGQLTQLVGLERGHADLERHRP
jgi:hypothetical protein